MSLFMPNKALLKHTHAGHPHYRSMWAAILLTLAALLLASIWRRRDRLATFWRVRQRCLVEFRKLNGPPTVPLLGTAYYFPSDPRALARLLLKWLIEYSAAPNCCGILAFWVGPVPMANITHGDAAKLIYHSSVNISKSAQYSKVREWIGDGLLTSDGEKWKSRRKMLTHTFHFSVLQDYHEVFCAHGKLFVELLQRKAGGVEYFDIYSYIKRCTLDIICETAMGCVINAQQGCNDEYVNAVVKMSDLIWQYETYVLNWFSPYWYLSGQGFQFDKNNRIARKFTENVIKSRKEEQGGNRVEKKKLAFLDFLLKAQRENELSDEGIQEEVDTFMFEGHDTTGSGINFTIWCLGQFPEYQQKVHDELDQIFGEDFERPPTIDDLNQMTYLDQCIKESMRLLPPVPFISRQLVEDVSVPHPTQGQVTLPAGLTVMLNQASIMKDARFYSRPLEFFPPHFEPQRVAAREPFAYVPFSAGPRNCIGQKFALMEEKTVLSWFFRWFTVESRDRWPEEIPVAQLVLKPLEGTWVKIRNRRKL